MGPFWVGTGGSSKCHLRLAALGPETHTVDNPPRFTRDRGLLELGLRIIEGVQVLPRSSRVGVIFF